MLSLEVVEQRDLVVERLLQRPPVLAVGRPGDGIAVVKQPGGRQRVARVLGRERAPGSDVAVAVKDEGAVPVRRHLDQEVGAADGAGLCAHGSACRRRAQDYSSEHGSKSKQSDAGTSHNALLTTPGR